MHSVPKVIRVESIQPSIARLLISERCWWPQLSPQEGGGPMVTKYLVISNSSTLVKLFQDTGCSRSCEEPYLRGAP